MRARRRCRPTRALAPIFLLIARRIRVARPARARQMDCKLNRLMRLAVIRRLFPSYRIFGQPL